MRVVGAGLGRTGTHSLKLALEPIAVETPRPVTTTAGLVTVALVAPLAAGPPDLLTLVVIVKLPRLL